MMSLRWRILGAFILLIVFTIVLSVGVETWSYRDRLGKYATDIRSKDFAGALSRGYTVAKSWDSDWLDPMLARWGLSIEEERLREAEALGKDISLLLPMSVVIRDNDARVVAASFADLEQQASSSPLEGEASPVIDLETQQVVGTVTLSINRAFLAADTRKGLIASLYPMAVGGAITAVLALVLALWLSRRITAPVVALTEATRSISESGETRLLPVASSDELGQMSTSFNQMITSLQTQRELRRRLVDDVSHELNTPLSVIRLEAGALSDGLQTPADAADHIIGEVDTLGNLVHDLNWLAAADAGAFRLDLGTHSLIRLVSDEVERRKLPAQVADVVLELLPLPPDLPEMRVDAMRISQALGNLLQNGLQHTSAGGRVTVQCSALDRWVEIAVCDTGSGISAQDLPHVFERFYRADPARERAAGRRGLGLSIVRQTMEAHGGEVRAESELGVGSCFRIRLPIKS